MKKRILVYLMVLCVVVGLAGCEAKRESAETVVKNALEAVKTYDTVRARAYWGNDDIGAESDEEVGQEAQKALFGGITYEIIGSEENDGTAVVDVKIINVDMSKVMTDVFASVFPTLLAEAFKPESEQMSDDESSKLFSDTLLEFLERSDNPQITNTVKVTLTLKDDVWVIDSGNEAAFDAMMGGISSFSNAMSEAFSESNQADDKAGMEGSILSESEVLKNIAVNAVPTLDGMVCVFITNNSTVVVDELGIQINYKDESGMIIDLDSDGHDMILPGYTVVSRMDAPDKYSDFEASVDIELGAHPRYKNHSDNVEISANQGENCVIVQITNGSEVTIDEVEYVVVLYSGNDIVSVNYPNDVYDVEAGKTVVEKDSTYGKIYDRFEIYLNQAHTFGFN